MESHEDGYEISYAQLRSQVYNLYHNPKHLTRKIRRLLRDINRASPASREWALQDGLHLELHEKLPPLVAHRTDSCRTVVVMNELRQIFGSKLTKTESI